MYSSMMKSSGNSYQLIWLSLTLLPLLFIAFLLPITPQDYWWYLRLGQDIFQTGSIPTVDAYSFTQTGRPIFYQSWLAAVVLWKTYEAGGFFMTFLVRGVIIAFTYSIVWLSAREAGAGPRIAGLLTFLAALGGSNNWSFRPQLFVYPLFVLVLYVLLRWTRGENKGLLTLPVLTILWVNLHGSYPLLIFLIIVALLWGGGNRKNLLIATGISSVAILVNPHGINTLGYVQTMLASQSNQFSIEWAPMINRGWQANLFFAWLLIFAPLTAFSPRKMPLLGWAYFLSFGWLALSGVRYVIWFLFILVVLTSFYLSGSGSPFSAKPVRNERARLNNYLSVMILSLPLIALPGVRDIWWPDAPLPYTDANPVDAANWLSEHPEMDGPLFSDYSYSSYLIFAIPSRPVWIDPRFELYPPEQWEKYSAIASASLQWQALLDEEGVNLVMLSKAGEPALITAMRESTLWNEDYQDETAVIFHRDNQ